MIHVADALKGMHDAGYCYLNLNPETIFLEGDGLNTVIGDLGIAKKEGARTLCGTLEYMAPEMWGEDGKKKRKAAPSMDVLSFGVTLFDVLHGTGEPLFKTMEERDMEHSIYLPH